MIRVIFESKNKVGSGNTALQIFPWRERLVEAVVDRLREIDDGTGHHSGFI